MVHVIITGGSSGIGAAIADRCARRGDAVSLVARDHLRLVAARADIVSRNPSAQVQIQAADVAEDAAIAWAITRCETAFGPCDVLVTCAGMVSPARFDEQAAAAFDAQIRVNLLGTANAVRAVYPAMKARRRGAILMVGSGASLIGIYGYTAYCASKYAVLGFAEALRFEARSHGVTVSVCLPPDTQTPQLAAELPLRPAEAGLIVDGGGEWTADAVAKAALAGMERGRFAIPVGSQLKLLHRFGSLALPILRPWFDRKIAAFKRSRPKTGA